MACRAEGTSTPLVTLVSHSQPLWRGVTQGGVAPVFPFGRALNCADARTMRYAPPMQRRPTVGPGSQKAPFRERLPGTISKLGKGTALQRWPAWGGGGMGRVGDRGGVVGVGCSEKSNRRVVRGGGSGSDSVSGSGSWSG